MPGYTDHPELYGEQAKNVREIAAHPGVYTATADQDVLLRQ
jgi:hypothetical protein